jgi:ankyrin repeat protein
MLGAKRTADEANIGNVPKEKVCKTDDYFENLIEYLGNTTDDLEEILLKYPEVISAEGSYGFTSIHYAAKSGGPSAIRKLLELGANIEAQDEYDRTPLHFAANNIDDEVVRILVDLGANKEALNINKQTPLHLAAEKGHVEAVQALVQLGANKEASNINQETPLHLAAEKGHVEAVQVLVALGANKEALNVNQETPLHLAAEKGRVEAVQVLVALGANKEALNINKETPLHLAARNGHVEAVRTLIQLGAKKKYPIRLSNIELPDEIECLPDLSDDQKTRKYIEEGGFIGSLIAHGVEFTLPAVVGLSVAISELRRVGKIYLDIKMSDPSSRPFINLILNSMSNPEILTTTIFAGVNIPPYLLTQFSNYDAKNNLLDVLAETQLQRKYLDANTMDEANAYYIAEHIFKKTLNLYLKYAAQIPDERAIEARRKAFIDVLVPVILEYKDSFCFPVMPTKLEIKLVARALNALQSEASKRHPNYKQALVNGVVATFRDWIEECQEQFTNPELNQLKQVLKDNCRAIAESVMNRFNDETLGSLDHNTKIRRRNMLCGLVYNKLCSSAHESPLENPEFLTLIEDRVLQAMLGQASSAVSMLKTSVEQAIDNISKSL